MFLNLLNQKEKELFLNLAIYIAGVDNEFSEKERNKIDSFCKEMEIECNNFTNTLSFDEIVENLSKLESFKRKIIILEITCLMLVDGLVKEEEKVLDQLIEKFQFNSSLKDEMIKWCQEYNNLILKGYFLIGEEVKNG